MKSFIKNKGLFIIVIILIYQYLLLMAAYSETASKTQSWLTQQFDFSLQKILDNTSPSDGDAGSIIAATSRVQPNYHYHWVRDAGLVVDSMMMAYPTSSQKNKSRIRKFMFDYLAFSTKIQHVTTLTGLGEPKFHVDGTAFNEPWARPQNDSPALRVISLIHWANRLLSEGELSFVKEKMVSPINMDLDYVSSHWKDASFDLWEEVKGKHFYTLMLERRALLEGALFAQQLGDNKAHLEYFKQAKNIEYELEKFWDNRLNIIVPTLDRTDGLDYKNSNIDSSVILGLLHGDMHDGFFAWDDVRVQATLNAMIQTFSKVYPINYSAHPIPGVAIGRYPEDRYSGKDFLGGNPWPLCTLAIAEAYYRYAQVLNSSGNRAGAIKAAQQADQFVERVRYHAHTDGSLDEQLDKQTGFMTSATDLTWNYAALLTTRQAMLLIN